MFSFSVKLHQFHILLLLSEIQTADIKTVTVLFLVFAHRILLSKSKKYLQMF